MNQHVVSFMIFLLDNFPVPQQSNIWLTVVWKIIIACVIASRLPSFIIINTPMAGSGSNKLIFTFKPVANRKLPTCH